MNLCKIVYKCNVTSFANNLRNFSVASNSTLDRRRKGFLHYKSGFVNKPLLINSYNKRNLSIEGIVKWQEQTYQSILNSSSVGFMQDTLLYFHESTGLSWSATIITATIFVRALMTLPLSIYQSYILAKVENIGLELKDLVNELRKETAIAKKMYNLSDKQTVSLYRRSMKKQWKLLIERDNCHPLKATLLIWFQIPIWVCMSFALRNLVNMHPPNPSALITFMEMEAGGFGWIPNLTVPDHSLILPITFGLVNLAIIEIQRMSKLREPSRLHTIFTNVFRTFSILMIPVAANVPSSLCLYWTTSSVFGLTQNLCLLSPKLRRKFKIPEAPSELEKPYSHMKEEINLKTPIIASIYTTGRDDQYFTKPNAFLPYRWDRNDQRIVDLANHVPSATLPFAMGARSCIGKKIAMKQMTEFVSEIIKNFDFKCTNDKRINSITSQVLIPDQHVDLYLSVRK